MISETSTFNRFKLPILLDKLRSGQSLLLFGPRQTGKSTLLSEIFSTFPAEAQQAYYFQLPQERMRIEADPEVIVREIEARYRGTPLYLYIDEVQKVPQVMDVLQFLIDRKRAVVAASGSSARKLRTVGANWLPGRVHLEHLYPITWQEIQASGVSISLEEMLRYGGLPAILLQTNAIKREEDLAAYTALYLNEEIRMEALSRNLPRFAKFLQLVALESGTSPNYSKIASRIGTSHTTVKEYYHILEDTLIVHSLKSFGTTREQVLRSPKYYFFDIGVRNAAAKIGHSQGILTLQMGVLFEHLIILETIARLNGTAALSYYRNKLDQEVDLIVELGSKRIAIEIKATAKPAQDDFKGIRAFCEKYPCDKRYLVCQVPQAQQFDYGLAIPWTELGNYLFP